MKRTAIRYCQSLSYAGKTQADIDEKMMYNTYNMGLGMVLAVDAADVDKTMEAIKAAGEAPYVVGRVEEGEKGVKLC